MRKAKVSFLLSVRPFIRMEQLCSYRKDFHERWYLSIFRKSVETIKVSLNMTRITYTLYEYQCTFLVTPRSVLLGMKNISNKLCRENQYTYFIWLFFSKLIRFPDRPQITIWSMRIVCWITKATNTLSEYVIFTAFPQQHWLQERAAMLRYTYTGCLVLTWHELKFPSRRKVGSGENNLLWYFITILHFTYGRLNKVLLQSFSWELLGHPCYCLGMWPVRTLVNNVSLFFLPHIFL